MTSLTLPELLDKLNNETSVPVGSTCTLIDEALLIYLLDVNEGGIPTITSSMTVKPDLAVVCGVDNKTVPVGEYSDLVKGSMRQLSQLVNLMARIKSWHRDSSPSAFGQPSVFLRLPSTTWRTEKVSRRRN